MAVVLVYGFVPAQEEKLFEGIVDACWRNEAVKKFTVLQCTVRQRSTLRRKQEEDDEQCQSMEDDCHRGTGSDHEDDSEEEQETVVREGIQTATQVEELRCQMESQSTDDTTFTVEDEAVSDRESVRGFLCDLKKCHKLGILEELGGSSLQLSHVPDPLERTTTGMWVVHAKSCHLICTEDRGHFQSSPLDMKLFDMIEHQQLLTVGELLLGYGKSQPAFHIFRYKTLVNESVAAV